MICLQNKGLMPLEAATTFGINVKIGENPIGFFGTGLKYAIAVCLRLGGKFQLFLGEVEYEFYTKDEDFRGTSFGMIYMKKRRGLFSSWTEEKLGYTTELGKHWEPWMAVRELESNCRDEQGTSYLSDGIPFLADDETLISVTCPEMEAAYKDLSSIFMPEKKLIFSSGMINIYEGESDYIFFRGLRVTDLPRPSLFTYDFDLGVTLTEDRTSRWPASDSMRIMEAIMTSTNLEMINKIMDAEDNKYFEGTLPFDQPYIAPATTFYAAMGFRAAEDLPMPTRIRTMYRNMTSVRDRKELLYISITEHNLRWLVAFLEEHDFSDDESEEIIKSCKEALENKEINF